MMTPNILIAAAAAVWVVGFSPMAQSQDYPDLVGTWTGTSEAVLRGSYPHASGNPAMPTEPQAISVDFVLTLTNQDGRRIWGTIASDLSTEPWLGVIQGNGETLLGVDTDGYIVGRIEDRDTIELCYVQTGDAIAASCTVFQRQ